MPAFIITVVHDSWRKQGEARRGLTAGHCTSIGSGTGGALHLIQHFLLKVDRLYCTPREIANSTNFECLDRWRG